MENEIKSFHQFNSFSEQDSSITAMYTSLMDKLHGEKRGSNFTPPKKKRKKKK